MGIGKRGGIRLRIETWVPDSVVERFEVLWRDRGCRVLRLRRLLWNRKRRRSG